LRAKRKNPLRRTKNSLKKLSRKQGKYLRAKAIKRQNQICENIQKILKRRWHARDIKMLDIKTKKAKQF